MAVTVFLLAHARWSWKGREREKKQRREKQAEEERASFFEHVYEQHTVGDVLHVAG
jgi:hypothetical protein